MIPESNAAAIRIIALLRECGTVPPALTTHVNAVIAAWESGDPDPDLLMWTKTALWGFLNDKHGDSTVIADLEDRAVRAALCLTEAPGDAAPEDLEEWAIEMLGPGA